MEPKSNPAAKLVQTKNTNSALDNTNTNAALTAARAVAQLRSSDHPERIHPTRVSECARAHSKPVAHL